MKADGKDPPVHPLPGLPTAWSYCFWVRRESPAWVARSKYLLQRKARVRGVMQMAEEAERVVAAMWP